MEHNFFMVHRDGSVGPSVKHATEEKAVEEAKRLAATNPGHKFYVLVALGVAHHVSVTYSPLDDIPF